MVGIPALLHIMAHALARSAARLQRVEPVAGQKQAWVPVAQRTVELEMGHARGDMVQEVYG